MNNIEHTLCNNLNSRKKKITEESSMKVECRDLNKIKEAIRKQRTSPIYMYLPAQ